MSTDELTAFLERHPWTSEMLGGRSPIDVLWHYDLPASPNALWPHLVDTSRFNRAIGITGMQFGEENGVLHGSTRNLGMLQEWVEVPWDWAWARSLASVRRYSRGFARVGRAFYELEAREDGGTRVWVYFGWVPNGFVSRLILRFLGMPWLASGYKKGMDLIAREVEQPHSALIVPAPELPPERLRRLRALEQQLLELELDENVVKRLAEHIERGDEMDLYRIQVPRLAAEMEVGEDALLETCLQATRVGLLELSWDVICPHCRGVRTQAKNLGQLPARDDCDVCAIGFGTADESSVEVTFRVHSSVREVPQLFFCSAEPATKTHIKLQQRVEAKETRRVSLELAHGEYRCRLRGNEEEHGTLVVSAGGDREVRWRSSESAPALRSGIDPTIVLENESDEDVTFVIEVPKWTHRALRPVRLFNLQRFRDLFSEEYLGADVQLSVGEQTILFTDVVGSTRFYQKRGDPDAFVEVKRHFAEVFEEIAQHRGAVVKTIGDAVMAAFVDGADAIAAAASIQRRFGPDHTLRVRISLHSGPCIAVNLNSGIDYFGSTVNLAAKLQAHAEAGEVALSKKTHGLPGVGEALEALGADLVPEELTHSALDEPMHLYRWAVSNE